jgi:hypothetical protein
VIPREGDGDFGPFFYQLDPKRQFFVPAKPEKLVRRGPCEYFLVGTKPDGERVEACLTSVTFRMDI